MKTNLLNKTVSSEKAFSGFLSGDAKRFLIRIGIVYGIYKIAFFIIWRIPELTQLHENIVVRFIRFIINNVHFLLNQLNYQFISLNLDERIIRIANSGGVRVSPPCSGLDIMFWFSVIIFTYPAKITRKIIFVLSGIVIIHLLNISRITALTLLSYHAPEWVEINHKLIFNIIVYSTILLIWLKFINDKKTMV